MAFTLPDLPYPHDANRSIADQPETIAAKNLADQPSGERADS